MNDQMKDNSNLFVANFSWNLGEDDLRSYFEEFGELESVKIITDRETGRSRGFGFVKFVNAEEAEVAIREMDGKEIDGRAIRVSVAEPRPPKREQY